MILQRFIDLKTRNFQKFWKNFAVILKTRRYLLGWFVVHPDINRAKITVFAITYFRLYIYVNLNTSGIDGLLCDKY